MSEIIVGVAGRARSGKNETAKYLQKYHAFHEDSFAMPIRVACMAVLGLKTLEELDEIKQIPHPLLGGKTPREFMQKMGTEFGREMIWQPIWIESCFGRCEKFDRLVISDVRFENEVQAIKDRGGFIIRVDRPSVVIEESQHASETGFSESYIDFEIVNDETLSDLYGKIEKIMKEIFIRVYKK